MDAHQIIKKISEAEKKTPARAYLKGDLAALASAPFSEVYLGRDHALVYEEVNIINQFLADHPEIELTRLEVDRRNSALPMADLTQYNARIEPGAIIREMVSIGDGAVIMMGAVLNIGAEIGSGTMIDMNVVLGGRAIVGKNCHIGAGAVLAGVIEPPHAKPVVVEDNVVMGANAVVLEGVTIGRGAVVAAGSVVVGDVEPMSVVAGIPAKVIKKVDEKTKSKTSLVDALRKL